jgi:hypothetical protein
MTKKSEIWSQIISYITANVDMQRDADTDEVATDLDKEMYKWLSENFKVARKRRKLSGALTEAKKRLSVIGDKIGVKRIQVEFLTQTYGQVSVFIDGDIKYKTGVSNVGALLKSISKKAYADYVDGCTIHYLTEQQVEKLKSLL